MAFITTVTTAAIAAAIGAYFQKRQFNFSQQTQQKIEFRKQKENRRYRRGNRKNSDCKSSSNRIKIEFYLH